jgi:hypothetical protein
VTGDATLVGTLLHAPGQLCTFRVGIQIAVGLVLGPKSVAVLGIIAGAFVHHGDGCKVLAGKRQLSQLGSLHCQPSRTL